MAYKKAIIAIPNVNGNIVVNVTTQGSVHNLFDVTNSVLNSRIGATGDVKSAGDHAGMIVTNEINCDGLDRIDLSGIPFVFDTSLSYYMRISIYDASHSTLTSVNSTDNPPPETAFYNVAGARAAHPTVKYVRFGIGVKNGTSITADDVANLMIIGS